MPVTSTTSDTKLIKQIQTQITGPWGPEEIAAMRREAEVLNSAVVYERKASAYVVVCQNVLTKANLPRWDTCVRLYADRSWADDLPEDWPERFPDILKPGESIIQVLALIELLYDMKDEVWWAGAILGIVDSERQ